jgi:two-component system NtrC family sensor kinase
LSLQDIPETMGVFWKLEEVFINLLMNSIDACTKEDSIEIETFLDNGSVTVVITDTGHGIFEKDIFKVFDPFYTTKEIGKGTGLGLSVCYNIIKQHDGDISLLSSEHGGTIVTVTLPVITSET